MLPLKLVNCAILLRTSIFMLPVLLLFYQTYGLTLADFFLFQGFFYLIALVMEIPAGFIADSFSKKWVFVFSNTLYLCRLLLFFLYPCWITILFGEVLFGISKAFFSGTTDGYIYELLQKNGQEKSILKSYSFFNLFMSMGTAFATLMGAWIYKQAGFQVILGIEICLNITAIAILCCLPNIQPVKKKAVSIALKYKLFFQAAISTLKNPQINVFIIYAGLLTAFTAVFTWSMQPLMKFFAIPVAGFGVVYFVNHIIRALSSGYAWKILNYFSFFKFAKISAVFFGVSFISLLILPFYAFERNTTCVSR